MFFIKKIISLLINIMLHGIDFLNKARELFRISLYSYNYRITYPPLPGLENNKNGLYCIYIIYSPFDLMLDHRVTLEEIKSKKINTICIFMGLNNKRSVHESFLKQHTMTTIYRKNIGRDFGGYKDGIKYLQSIDSNELERLIIMNDSCLIRRKGFQYLLDKLLSNQSDITSAFENFQHSYHLQSFCLSFSKYIFKHDLFIKFWKKYTPFNSRFHAIQNGEKGLTKVAKKITSNIYIIYKPSYTSLEQGLIHKDDTLNFKLLHLLPTKLRLNVLNTYTNRIGTKPSFNKYHNRIFFSNLAKMTNQQIIEQCSRSNSIHYFGPIAATIENCPLIKKDIFFRGIYETFVEAETVIGEFYQDEDDLYELAIKIIRHKSNIGSDEPIIKRLMTQRGFI